MSAIFVRLSVLAPLLVALLLVDAASGAPSSKGNKHSLTFDQKQSGEYNIQLHLKDFQIIAVVGEDSLGSLGDYDYNYDYSDFTVKPPPAPNPAATTTSKKPDLIVTDKPLPTSPSTNKDSTYAIFSPSTPKPTTKPSISTSNLTTLATSAPILNATSIPEVKLNSTLLAASSNVSTTITSSFTTEPSRKTTTSLLVSSSSLPEALPGQIPVIVQEQASIPEKYLLKDKKRVEAVTIVSVHDDAAASGVNASGGGTEAVLEQANLGEILLLKRCAQGYSKDKRGRCRKIRRPPQIPIEITRFASNLAARFRQASSSEQQEQGSGILG